MPPQGSMTKHHLNGALEKCSKSKVKILPLFFTNSLNFIVIAQHAKNCTTQSCHWATVETVSNGDHIAHTMNTVLIPTQSADAPMPASPTHNTHCWATVEDADHQNHDNPSAPNATAQPPTNSASISDTTPQCCWHQEDSVDEGGPMEGKSNSHILIFLNWCWTNHLYFRSVSCSNPTFCSRQSSCYFTTLHHPGPPDASKSSFLFARRTISLTIVKFLWRYTLHQP